MTNKEKIENKIKSLGYEVGCCDEMLNTLTASATKKVLDALDEECTDVFITMKKITHVVIEISTVDNEKDVTFNFMTDYFKKYGDLEEALDNEKINQTQYHYLKKVLEN